MADEKIQKIIILTVTFFVAVAVTTWIRLAIANADDFQERAFVDVQWQFDKDYSIDLNQKFHWTDNTHRFYLNQYKDAIGISYYPLDWLTFTGEYIVDYKLEDGTWNFNTGPRLGAEFKFKEWDFKFSDKLRLEFMPDKNEPAQLRDKLEVKYTKYDPIQPFVSDEVFLSLSDVKTGLLMNRLYIGFTIPALKNLDIDTFYLLETDENDHTHAIGVETKFNF